jgi:hypothetical protein
MRKTAAVKSSHLAFSMSATLKSDPSDSGAWDPIVGSALGIEKAK